MGTHSYNLLICAATACSHPQRGHITVIEQVPCRFNDQSLTATAVSYLLLVSCIYYKELRALRLLRSSLCRYLYTWRGGIVDWALGRVDDQHVERLHLVVRP